MKREMHSTTPTQEDVVTATVAGVSFNLNLFIVIVILDE